MPVSPNLRRAVAPPDLLPAMDPTSSDATAPCIVVLGSLNMDLLLRVPRAPAAGETLLGHAIDYLAGGKGGNQAVSCARQGARVHMLGCVGDDAYGRTLCETLGLDGIDTAGVQIDVHESTGVALVMVDDSGQNRIVVVPGANGSVQVDDAALAQQLHGAAFLLVQFETPQRQVRRALEVAARVGCPVLLNPSPVAEMPADFWSQVDTLVVNEIEAQALGGLPVRGPAEAAAAAHALRARGPARVVVTLGAHGAVAADAQGCRHHPARRVEAMDTTAAGDTFLGAFAVALAGGRPFDEAVQLGIRAAALCVARPGAQPSIPSRAEVLRTPLPPDWIDL